MKLVNDTKGERGSITIMTAIFSLLLLLMVGLTIDISRIYLVRSELQNAADAAALTAARELNGGTGGIDDAVTQATTVIANNQGLRAKSNVTITSANVEFAEDLDGTFMSAGDAKAPSVVPNIKYVRVTTNTTTTTILFASSALGVSHTESRQAVAGMSVELSGVCDFYPAVVGLTNPNPAPGNMTLKFAQGSGNTAQINDRDYIVLDVDCITGNGEVETARLAAGEPCSCKKKGDHLSMTPSSNFGNGGRAAGDGMNTRFGIYAGGYGGWLTAANYPADDNVSTGLTYQQYADAGGNGRRVVIAPIIFAPMAYPADSEGEVLGWGKFFLRAPMAVPNGNCANTPPCGYMEVEYLGEADVGANGDVSCGSGLRTAVLYR
jgi:Flp pilus assembly protein TadG